VPCGIPFTQIVAQERGNGKHLSAANGVRWRIDRREVLAGRAGGGCGNAPLRLGIGRRAQSPAPYESLWLWRPEARVDLPAGAAASALTTALAAFAVPLGPRFGDVELAAIQRPAFQP